MRSFLALGIVLALVGCESPSPSGHENRGPEREDSEGTATTLGAGAAIATTPTTLPEHGAGLVGPAWEPATTDGLMVDSSSFPESIESARSGQTILIRAGTYSGSFSIPEGVTVKPYQGETVSINGQIGMGSGSTIAGLRLSSSRQWVIRVDNTSVTAKSDIVIRNNEIFGGTVESIRVSRNVRDVLITGNDISGGGNHVIKVHGEGSGYAPSAIIRNNRIYGPVTEDCVQTEENGPVTIDHNTFWEAPENAVDLKDGELVTVSNNLFDGSTLTESSLLVHHFANALVTNNRFSNGAGVMLGSKEYGDPSMEFRENIMEGGEIILRMSFRPAIVEDNVLIGGYFRLGWRVGDHPRDARILSNQMEGTELIDWVTPAGDAYLCSGNRFVRSTGELSQCETG